MASPNLCLWLQSTVPFPFLPLARAELLPCALSWLRVSICPCCPPLHVTNTPHPTEAHLPSWTDIQTPPWDTLRLSAWLSGWVRTWSWISWQHRSLCMSVFLWDFFPTSSCRPQQHPPLQGLSLHVIPGVVSNEGIAWQKEKFINCSWCLVSSVLKPRGYIKCWVFFLSEYLGTKSTQILIVHQIAMRFFNVLVLMLSGLKLFASIPLQVQPSLFCFLWFLQTLVAHLLWEWKRGSKEKALPCSVKGNWFYGIGDGRNSAKDRAQRYHFESWIWLCC